MTLDRFAALAMTVLAVACVSPPPESPVAFATDGGDAWTFDKLIDGSVQPGACDTVRVGSPRGAVIALPLDDRFMARVPLAAGPNRVEAECLDHGRRRGAVAAQDWTVRVADGPVARIRALVESDGIRLDAGASELAPSRPAPITRFDWLSRAGDPPLPGLPATGRQLTLPLPTADGEYHPRLRITDARGRSDESQALIRVAGGRAEVIDAAIRAPAWISGAIVYGIAPQLFGPRGLPDVTARLDDIAALGVNTLWLSPVSESPSGDYGYAVTDYFRVRASLGGEAALRELVRAAHARGLRVILDVVPNHLAALHPYFLDAAARGPRSPYYRYFARDAAGHPAHYFDWQHLQNLDYDNPEVQRLVIEACAQALRDFDVDGFRMDAAWGPRQRAPEFWPRWRRELTRIKPDLLLIAEAPARDPYYVTHGFDAAYDWTDQLGHWAWQAAFDDPARTVPLLRAALSATPGAQVLRFLDNNDTQRFVTRYGAARTRVAAAMLLTLPGIPSLFMGDEVGAEFQVYGPPHPIDWTDRFSLRAWYRRLIALRRAQPMLRDGAFHLVDAPQGVLAYERGDAEDRILVLLNYGAAARRMSVPRAARDLLSGEAVKGRSVTLAPYDVKILTTRPSADRDATSRGRGSAPPVRGR